MKISMNKFGELLISRPSGREAFLAARAYLLSPAPSGDIELDFSGVKVLAPSWADEFISGLKKNFPNTIKAISTQNASVQESLKTIGFSTSL